MKRFSDTALKECIVEFRAACRLPVDEAAIDMVAGWLRPNFERILDHPDGMKRWADHGQRMRDNARHLGGFADFFASHADARTIGIDELKRGLQIVRAECTVRAEQTPVAYEYCSKVPLDATRAEEFLQDIAPSRELV